MVADPSVMLLYDDVISVRMCTGVGTCLVFVTARMNRELRLRARELLARRAEKVARNGEGMVQCLM